MKEYSGKLTISNDGKQVWFNTNSGICRLRIKFQKKIWSKNAGHHQAGYQNEDIYVEINQGEI